MSFIEGATGLGLLFGPIIGAGLYALFGYCGPFFSLAIINSIVYYLMVKPILKLVSVKEEILVSNENTI